MVPRSSTCVFNTHIRRYGVIFFLNVEFRCYSSSLEIFSFEVVTRLLNLHFPVRKDKGTDRTIFYVTLKVVDPRYDMNFVELVNSYGYFAEEHFVKTEDGVG